MWSSATAASTLYCIPAVWQRILDEDTGHDTSGLVEALTGTSLVTLDLIDAIKARFPGSWTSIAYGSSRPARSEGHDHGELTGQILRIAAFGGCKQQGDGELRAQASIGRLLHRAPTSVCHALAM